MSPPVFISHSSRDRKIAQTLCDALERRGIGCWISSRDIISGANFQEAIVQAVRSARVMILVFTSNANNSNEIKKELALASQHGLSVIPVRVEDVLPSDAFSYEFATRQWIDVFGDWERSVGRLADDIRIALEESPGAGTSRPAPVVSRPATAKRNIGPYTVIIAIILACGAIGGGIYALAVRPPTPSVAVTASPPITPGRLGHFTTADGRTGFVLDRSGAVPLVRFDGSSEIVSLSVTPASLGDVALRRADGYVLLRIDPEGVITLYDDAHGDGAVVHRDSDAPPLAVAGR